MGRKPDLDRQEKFVDALARGASHRVAATEAGYDSGEADRLLKQEGVRERLLERLEVYRVSARKLTEAAKAVCAKAITEYLAERAAGVEHKEYSATRLAAIQAAKTVLDTFRRAGIPLAAAAEAEDAAIQNIEAARAILSGGVQLMPVIHPPRNEDGSEKEQ